MFSWLCMTHLKQSSYLGVCDEQTVGVLMLTGDLILRQHVSELLDEDDHLLVPGDVSHGQSAGRAFPTVRHPLDTQQNMIRTSQCIDRRK